MKDLGSFIKGDHSTGARHAAKNAVHLCNQISTLLDSYLGDDALHKRREFTFLKNVGLRKIVERDFHELDQKAFHSGSDKIVVILAGGILEAVLYDLLTRDAARVANVMSATKTAKKRGGIVRDILSDGSEDEWHLEKLIDVAFELALLPTEREASIDHVLREYRNFVHARRELKSGYSITRSEAMMAMGALLFVVDHVGANHP